MTGAPGCAEILPLPLTRESAFPETIGLHHHNNGGKWRRIPKVCDTMSQPDNLPAIDNNVTHTEEITE